MGKAFGLLLFLITAAGATAVREADDGINDGVDRTDPNFVIVAAYVVFYAKQGIGRGDAV